MPPVFSKTRPSTIQPFPVPQPDFAFPANKHLLITTPSRIVSWDETGIHDLFTSSKSGIAAATESKDGTGILAVADKHTVVLHDTQRGKEKSWGLSAPEDEVRHLEYTKDSRNLFLTTMAANAIQCYSTQAQQLLNPPQILSSPAVALAISPTGHLMISAQGTPPVVFLKDLSKNSTATLLKPQASTSGITIAAFHPERANIFLLAFDDGTLAVFDANRLRRGVGEGKYNDQSHTGKAEIGRKTQLHRAIHYKTESRSRAINGAAFLPGQNLKTITVGIDGRCKLLDFSNGTTNVLRTWHAEAPLTCVSVSALPRLGDQKTESSGRLKSPGTLIAMGSQDGKVLIYDSLGLLQSVKKINSAGERVIGVEWVDGASPKSLSTAMPLHGYEALTLPSTVDSPAKLIRDRGNKSTPKHLSIHPALRPSTTNPIASTSSQTRRFTIHPDEAMNDSTVRHTPKAQGNYMVSAEAGEYLDLFSPVNPFAAERTRANREKSYSPTRARPRISSQTFTKGTPKPKAGMITSSLSQAPILLPTLDSHATSSSSIHTGVKRSVQFRSPQSTAKGSPLKSERRRLNPASVRRQATHRTDSGEIVDATVVSNARLLRELRQMGARTANAHAAGITKSYKSGDSQRREVRPERLQAPVREKIIESSPLHPGVQVYGPGGRWPTDSVDEPSWSEEQQDDIWITSDEERKTSSRRIHGIERPAARQTSRSRMDSKGAVSRTQATTQSPAAMPPISAPKATDGLTSTDDYTTALSHASPDTGYSLASDDVKSLFPRTSSKSPQKSKSAVRETPKQRKTALQEIASNAAQRRRASDPWTKVKQLRGLPAQSAGVAEPNDHVVVDRVVPPHPRGEACSGCTANASKVKALEGEVAHMKGEILALRAMLRRNGIPTPAVSRR
jgi:WD40 repeat protein